MVPVLAKPAHANSLGLSVIYYLLKNPKRIKNNNPYITLNKEEYFYFCGVLKQLVVQGSSGSYTVPQYESLTGGTLIYPLHTL